MEARGGEKVGGEEWEHLDRVCKEVAPEEEGEEGVSRKQRPINEG